MEIVLLARPKLPAGAGLGGCHIETQVAFEKWLDHWYETASRPDLMYVGTVLDDLLTQSDAEEALLKTFDMGVYPSVIVLTTPNPLALCRQTQLLRLMGYCQPADRMWTYLPNQQHIG